MSFKKKKIHPKLTIAYVTYCRKDLIVRHIDDLLKIKIPSEIEILVIDDNSNDGTFKKLTNLTQGTKIKVFKNKNNLGFADNYMNAIQKSKGEYVLWVSDKDKILFSEINNVMKFISRKNFLIDVLILNHMRKIKKNSLISNIRKNKTRIVQHYELWKCSHGPGIMWKRIAALKQLKKWRNFKKNYPELAFYYPNLFLIIKLLPLGRCYFFNGEIAYQAEYAKYSFFDVKNDKERYGFLNSRWLQHKNLVDFLEISSRQKKFSKYYNSMRHSLNLNLHSFISTAIREERPNLYGYWFTAPYSPFLIFKKSCMVLRLIVYYLILEPKWVIKKINQRLELIFKRNK